MSQSNSATERFRWKVYKNTTSIKMRVQFLRNLDLKKNLPLVTWEGQVGMLDGAPDEAILRYLPLVYWKAQVILFDKHLSAGRLKEAEKLLDIRAKKKLGIAAPKSKVSYRRFSY